MVDGVQLLRSIEESPGRDVLLPHDQALAIAQALASAQLRQERIDAAIASMIAGIAH